MPIQTDAPLVIAPMPTPFDEHDAVDHGAIERNVQRWRETALCGFVLNSENGEEAFLSEAERLEIIRTVHRAANGDRLIIAGIDNPSVTETLRLAETYAESGAELLRIRIPRLTTNIRGYFEQVIPRAAVPVIVIHQTAPGLFLQTGTSASTSPEMIGEIVAADNVYGYITYDNIRFESRVRQFVPADKQFWISNASLLLPGAAIGANGGGMMLINVAPKECQEVLRLVMEGKLAEAQTIQTRLLAPDHEILRHGAAGIKAAMTLLGYEMGLPRRPSPPCSNADVEQIRKAMDTAGLLPKS